MTITNKKVTLSYGAFSCSLQGFDDKFEILEPIANYFRDLLVDTPQRGKGKPQRGKGKPVPVADDLARIVGDVISHPVEGYKKQGVIVLRLANVDNAAGVIGGDVETADETPEQTDGALDPVDAEESLSEAAGGRGQTLEETLAAISDVLVTGNEAEKTQGPDIELMDEGNISGKDPIGGVKAAKDDPASEGDSSDGDMGDEGNIFKEDKPVGEDQIELETTGNETKADAPKLKEETPKPIVRPSRIARVIKMKRADFDAAIDGGVIEEDPDAPDEVATPEGAKSQAQELSPESEADLQRQLAETEEASEGPQEAIMPTKPQEAIKPTKPKVTKRRKGVDRLQSSERRSDLERIFEEADSQMGKSDKSDRRNALQHLRAAVAATRAEELAGHELDRNIDETPYRSDLAEAVDAPPGKHG
ncbi:hypothetical protein MNBD_ALPHA07-1144 [hydrothermal vent metagenome]|uniref:Uncharacterized protein n=1 Tax=hydrothermal vent metagenome TaxID=652676 RepID=A0A3B0TDA5_9ZZZZ